MDYTRAGGILPWRRRRSSSLIEISYPLTYLPNPPPTRPPPPRPPPGYAWLVHQNIRHPEYTSYCWREPAITRLRQHLSLSLSLPSLGSPRGGCCCSPSENCLRKERAGPPFSDVYVGGCTHRGAEERGGREQGRGGDGRQRPPTLARCFDAWRAGQVSRKKFPERSRGKVRGKFRAVPKEVCEQQVTW